jgi:hypothetical protein
MLEHLSQSQIQAIRERTLPPEQLLTVDQHLETCDECSERLFTFVEPSYNSLVNEIYEDSNRDLVHVPSDELVRFVQKRTSLSESEIIESHLEICEQCQAIAYDLKEFESNSELYLEGSSLPERPVLQKESKGIVWTLKGILELFQMPALQMAGVAATILIAAGLILFLNKREPPQVAEKETKGPLRPAVENLPAPPTPADKEPPLVAVVRDRAGEISIDEEQRISGLEGFPESNRREIAAAIQTGRVNPPSLKDLGSKKDVLLGDNPEQRLRIISPAGIIVKEERPRIRWSSVEGATSYVVTIVDSELNEVVTSPELTTTDWTPTVSLKRAETYTVQVKVNSNTAAAKNQAKFKVLEADKYRDVLRVEKSRSHLARGVVYARVGLLSDAEREFSALVKLNPNSAIPKKLLRSVTAAKKGLNN